MKEIASYIAKQEGKKHQASVGDVREILGLVSDIVVRSESARIAFMNNGRRRAAKKKAKRCAS